jgi:hypothetical protein
MELNLARDMERNMELQYGARAIPSRNVWRDHFEISIATDRTAHPASSCSTSAETYHDRRGRNRHRTTTYFHSYRT